MENRNQSHKYYFDHPEIWEEINQSRFECEAAFLAAVFERYGRVRDLLDVGCGTGSHLAMLVNRGRAGTGIDINAMMISFARHKHQGVAFAVKDMRELDYHNEFDAITCLCTTFSYNVTNEEAVASLRGFWSALRQGGLVIIDLLNAMAFIRRRHFEDRLVSPYPAFGLISQCEHQIDELRQVLIEKRSILSAGDQNLIKTDTTVFRLFFPQELRYFLETTGFEFLAFYGAFDLAHTALDDARMIAVARKP